MLNHLSFHKFYNRQLDFNVSPNVNGVITLDNDTTISPLAISATLHNMDETYTRLSDISLSCCYKWIFILCNDIQMYHTICEEIPLYFE